MLFLHVPLQSDGKFPIIQTEIIPESSYAGGSDMNTIFIGIAGGTGSGKTTLTEHLVSRFGDDIAVVHHDNYYTTTTTSGRTALLRSAASRITTIPTPSTRI